jgi:hypothetical protein
MAIIVGIVLALAAGIMATGVGLDRDRAFYPVITIVIGFLYALFAVMGGSNHALMLELIGGLVFLSAAIIGFRSSLWLVAAALAGHGVFDIFHGSVIANPGVPTFWPQFCSAYDITAGAYMAWLLRSGRLAASA